MKRKFTLFLAVLILLSSLPGFVGAEELPPVKLWIDGEYVQTDVAPFIENDRTLVPIRVISETLGIPVDWDPVNRQVHLTHYTHGLVYTFFIDQAKYAKGDMLKDLDVAARIVNDRTFVPIRVIAEIFGHHVDWDNDNRTVIIGDGYKKSTPQKSTNTFAEARVVNVVDGDTIDVILNGQKQRVRFILVDTPETKHPNKGVECYGHEASAYTTQQLSGKTVYLEKDVSETDRYGRLLRYVWLARPMTNNPTEKEIATKCFNSLLLENGYARIATFPPDVKYVDFFRTREGIARDNDYGLWGQCPIESASQPTPQPDTKPVHTTEAYYVGNKNSKIYHRPSCPSVKKMKEKNKVILHDTTGYRPCKICKP